jgi:hypothetical protein
MPPIKPGYQNIMKGGFELRRDDLMPPMMDEISTHEIRSERTNESGTKNVGISKARRKPSAQKTDHAARHWMFVGKKWNVGDAPFRPPNDTYIVIWPLHLR